LAPLCKGHDTVTPAGSSTLDSGSNCALHSHSLHFTQTGAIAACFANLSWSLSAFNFFVFLFFSSHVVWCLHTCARDVLCPSALQSEHRFGSPGSFFFFLFLFFFFFFGFSFAGFLRGDGELASPAATRFIGAASEPTAPSITPLGNYQFLY
jgi:hypothetical protein